MLAQIIPESKEFTTTELEVFIGYDRTDGCQVHLDFVMMDGIEPVLCIGVYTPDELRQGEPGAGIDLSLLQSVQLRELLLRESIVPILSQDTVSFEPLLPTSRTALASNSRDSAAYRRTGVYLETILMRDGFCFEIGVPVSQKLELSPSHRVTLAREELILLCVLMAHEDVRGILDHPEYYVCDEGV